MPAASTASLPGSLPFTGIDLGRWLVVGLASLLLGLMLRRRRSAAAA
jgi:hypothetical protein